MFSSFTSLPSVWSTIFCCSVAFAAPSAACVTFAVLKATRFEQLPGLVHV
jgi:hypothetical protein